ncbi:uncharacterized protein LOC128226167 isoform X2 [Mya arenaria]|uniref:uncharacterized protein LOC128226167 isoform X2 n=1 Tax=Mya arenaria TaxID=6604 RepID=UPI0022DE9A9D|nr:uncharacterized protein LOC128226167 isoform X2 [Mya arenaria]
MKICLLIVYHTNTIRISILSQDGSEEYRHWQQQDTYSSWWVWSCHSPSSVVPPVAGSPAPTRGSCCLQEFAMKPRSLFSYGRTAFITLATPGTSVALDAIWLWLPPS